MFTTMLEGTQEDWAHIGAEHGKHQVSAAPQQIMESLRRLAAIEVGFAIAAEILKPYVSDDLYHTVKWHQDFQGRYYYEYMGKSKDMRDRFKDEPWFATAEKLVDRWDAPAFDPNFKADSLESFEPEVTAIFSRPVRAY